LPGYPAILGYGAAAPASSANALPARAACRFPDRGASTSTKSCKRPKPLAAVAANAFIEWIEPITAAAPHNFVGGECHVIDGHDRI
jgi:hypothetical protein